MSSSLRSARRTVQSARVTRAETSYGGRPKTAVRSRGSDFTDAQQQQLSATSRINAELSTHPSTFEKQSRVPYHTIPSRLGRFNLQQKLDHPFKMPETQVVTTREITEETKDSDSLFVTFDLLKTMTPRNCVKCLSSTPIFMRTMFLEGKLDPDLVSSVSLSLTQNELQKFMLNMTQEINFFSVLSACQTIQEVETKLVDLIPMKRATIWVKSEHSNFVVSTTMKESLVLGNTIITEAFDKREDIVTGDPANHSGFSVDSDLPLLRGIKSMMILPIMNPNEEVVAVLQCCGFQNPVSEVQAEFSQYYIDVLKIVRDIVQKRLFSVAPPRTVPSNISNIFADIDKSSVAVTSQQICKFIQASFPCETAELFEFDDKYRCLVRLTDGARFGELEGGVSFQAGLSMTPINLSNCQNHPSYNRDIDGRFANKSLLTKSLYHGRDHFVVTLRAKPNSPAFLPKDVKLLGELGTVICDALKLARWLDSRAREREQTLRDMTLLNVVCDSIHSVASVGADRWETVRKAAKQFFDCDNIFVCLFDGRFMKYLPTEVKSKFEDCSAGTSFNYRETVKSSETDENSKFNPALYKDLGVKCSTSLCFPYRTNGRVAGAIEIINPKKEDVTEEDQKLFSNVCAMLLSTLAEKK